MFCIVPLLQPLFSIDVVELLCRQHLAVVVALIR